MVGHMFALFEILVADLAWLVGPAPSRCLVGHSHARLDFFKAASTEVLCDQWLVVAFNDLELWRPPVMLRTPTFTDAIQPRIERLKVIFHIGIPLRKDLV